MRVGWAELGLPLRPRERLSASWPNPHAGDCSRVHPPRPSIVATAEAAVAVAHHSASCSTEGDGLVDGKRVGESVGQGPSK
jgi:hypothetical protein